MSQIVVRSLKKTFVTRKGITVDALDGLNMSVDKGEFVTVVGPSGCGKSTLLKILAGLIPPSEGEVLLGNRPIQGPSKDIGVVFQNPLLFDWRTVTDNIMLPVQVLKLPKKNYEKRCQDLIGMTKLDRFSNSYPWELSGGMQQRVSICRALVFDPKILLMDEPLGALDAMTRDHMNVELLKIWEASKKTVILITHSISEAVFLADRVLVMSARPGSIEESVQIDLGRPRALEQMSCREFGEYVLHIREYFKADAVS